MMTKEDMQQMFAEQPQDNHNTMDNLNKRMDNLYTKLESITDDNVKSNDVVYTGLSTVQEQMRILQDSANDNRVKVEHQLVQLELLFLLT